MKSMRERKYKKKMYYGLFLLFLIIIFVVYYGYLCISCHQFLRVIMDNNTTYKEVANRIKDERIFELIHDCIGMNGSQYLSQSAVVRISTPCLLVSGCQPYFYFYYSHDDSRSKSWNIPVKLFVHFTNPLSWEIIDYWEAE